MRTPMEVLRLKEQQILKVKKEIEALRITARLLFDEGSAPAPPPEEKKQDLRQLIEMP